MRDFGVKRKAPPKKLPANMASGANPSLLRSGPVREDMTHESTQGGEVDGGPVVEARVRVMQHLRLVRIGRLEPRHGQQVGRVVGEKLGGSRPAQVRHILSPISIAGYPCPRPPFPFPRYQFVAMTGRAMAMASMMGRPLLANKGRVVRK